MDGQSEPSKQGQTEKSEADALRPEAAWVRDTKHDHNRNGRVGLGEGLPIVYAILRLLPLLTPPSTRYCLRLIRIAWLNRVSSVKPRSWKWDNWTWPSSWNATLHLPCTAPPTEREPL